MTTPYPAAHCCPICGQLNACVAAARGVPGDPCWCADVRFTPELLARVPPALRGVACICRACADAASVQTPPPPQATLRGPNP